MKKVGSCFFVLLYLFISSSCSKEASETFVFTPPSNLFGTWKAPLEDEQYMQLTIRKNTLIEENYSPAFSNVPYIDFSREYDSDAFIVTQVVGESSYEFAIERKDGGVMDDETGQRTLFRKYRLVNYNNQVVLELMYQGTFGAYLIRN